MKIFVSGQITDLENVRSLQDRLTAAGHVITHDWTRNETGDKMLAGDAAKLADMNETAGRAQKDIQGVIDCDAYVICTDNQKAGKGMYVELGAAIALHETVGKPKLYLIGGMNHMSIFYFHKSVIRASSPGELLDLLSSN